MEGPRLILPRGFYTRPLSKKEAVFAEDNINIVYWYLRTYGLDEAEWYDVVIFGYLLAVKKYLSVPSTQKVKFVTVAANAMRSCVGNVRDKDRRQPKTVSLYDTIPGTEDLMYIDILSVPDFTEELF